MRELATVQEKILDRALYLIGKHGNYDVPIRDITKAAGVNVNAISYYFRNKETMLQAVDEFFIQNYIAAYAVLDTDETDERKLLLWANEVMEYTLQYPGIQLLQRNALQSSNQSKMKEFLLLHAKQYDQKVLEVAQKVFHTDSTSTPLLKTMLYSALLHPASFGTDDNFDTSEIEVLDYRLKYIQFVLNTLKKGTDNHEV